MENKRLLTVQLDISTIWTVGSLMLSLIVGGLLLDLPTLYKLNLPSFMPSRIVFILGWLITYLCIGLININTDRKCIGLDRSIVQFYYLLYLVLNTFWTYSLRVYLSSIWFNLSIILSLLKYLNVCHSVDNNQMKYFIPVGLMHLFAFILNLSLVLIN